MRAIPFRAVEQSDCSIVQRAQDSFRTASTLADVLAIGRTMSPAINVSEIVTQDEYTHDVIVSFGSAHFLSFDTT
jgi:hypothetical protein